MFTAKFGFPSLFPHFFFFPSRNTYLPQRSRIVAGTIAARAICHREAAPLPLWLSSRLQLFYRTDELSSRFSGSRSQHQGKGNFLATLFTTTNLLCSYVFKGI